MSFYSTVMWNHGSNAGLLLLFLSAVCWNFLSSCLAQDVHHLHCCEAAVGVDSPRMALRYTARQLLNLNGNLNLACALCSRVGKLRPKCYMHRSSRRSLLCSTSKPVAYPIFLRKPQRLLFRPTGVHFNNLSALKRVEVVSDSSTPSHLLKSALFNVRSVNNKSVILSEIILEQKMDLVRLTETWHKESDGLLFNELTPVGYGLFDLPCSSGRGGGIIVLHNQHYNVCPVVVPKFDSFGCLALSVSAPLFTAVATVYRPPKTNTDFLSEFSDILSFLCLKFERILLLGDFNIHIYIKDSTITKYVLSLWECFELNQLVDCPTHNKGHTLDLVISNGSFVSQLSTSDLGLSDHQAVFFNMELPDIYTTSSPIINYRK